MLFRNNIDIFTNNIFTYLLPSPFLGVFRVQKIRASKETPIHHSLFCLFIELKIRFYFGY